MSSPLSTAIAIAARGAAGILADRGIDAGVEWIRTHLGAFGSETRERAEANQRDFLGDLVGRIQSLEETLRAGGEDEAELERRVTDPDFNATLQDALIAAARTESPEKHSLLANAVATRFGAAPESPAALACACAVGVIPRLTLNQLDILGLLTFMHRVIPAPGWPGQSLTPEEVIQTLHQYWHWAVSPYVRAIELRPEDVAWLAAHGCILYLPHMYPDVRSVMQRGIAEIPERELFIDQFLTSDCGRRLAELWATGLQSAYPELMGALIGGPVHDLRTRDAAPAN
jgi:hypothetical protein